MKNCQATLSGSFIAEFESGGAAFDHAGFPASRRAPQSRPDAYKLRFITLLPRLSRATSSGCANWQADRRHAGAPEISAAWEAAAAFGSIFGFSSPGIAQRMSLWGSGRKSLRQLTGTARFPAPRGNYPRVKL